MVPPTSRLPASNFLTGEELARDDLLVLLDRAEELKRGRAQGEGRDSLAGRSVALLFEYSPRRRQPEASWLAFGAGVSVLLWLVFMGVLALYMDATRTFGATYGPIAGTIGSDRGHRAAGRSV